MKDLIIPKNMILEQCPSCKGKNTESCKKCKGTGLVYSESGEPSKNIKAKQCPKCKGITGNKCSLCDGVGSIIENIHEK